MQKTHQVIAQLFHKSDDQVSACLTKGLFSCFSQRYEEAGKWFAQALRKGKKSNHGTAMLYSCLLSAYAMEKNGSDLEGALGAISEAQELIDSAGFNELECQLSLWRGRLYVLIGEHDLAKDWYGMAADLAMMRNDMETARKALSFPGLDMDLSQVLSMDMHE